MDKAELRSYFQPLVKWWWLLAIAAMIAGTSSFLYVLRQPSLYQARATLMIGSIIQNPNPNGSEIYLAQQLAQTYADITMRSAVQRATMEALGTDWLPAYYARAIPNTQLLEITVTDLEPERAQVVAQELVNQLILQSPAGQSASSRQIFVQDRLQRLETSILATEEEITRLQAELAGELSASKIEALRAEILTLEEKVNTLQSNYAELLSTTQKGASNAVSVLEPAALPQYPVGNNMAVNVMVAVLFGLVLAGGAAYLVEYMDDTIKNIDHVQRQTGLTTVATIPELPNSDTQGEQQLIMVYNPLNPAAESYRVLRTNLQYASIDEPLHMLQVTSPTPGDGKSVTSANLSATFAHGGLSVILIDADFRRPTQHKLFGVANNYGVTTALLDGLDDIDQILRPTAVEGLRLLTSGPIPPNPSELLGSKRMQQLLASARGQADIVIVDSPPVTVVSDTAVIASRMDGVLLVLKSGHTRKSHAQHATQALQNVNANILGVVLNRTQASAGGYQYYNYGYAYGYTAKPSRSSSAAGKGAKTPRARRSAADILMGRSSTVPTGTLILPGPNGKPADSERDAHR